MASKAPPPDMRPDLSADVVADFEEEEGPPLGVQSGQDRTVIPEHADRIDHGPKTKQFIRDRISRRV